jgi:hypothetical protein
MDQVLACCTPLARGLVTLFTASAIDPVTRRAAVDV